MKVLDDGSVELICPKCGRLSRRDWTWLKTLPASFNCPECGVTNMLDHADTGKLGKALDIVDEAMQGLRRAVDALKPRM